MLLKGRAMGEAAGRDVMLHVRVQPKASRNEVIVEPDGRIRVALTAPPVEGAANEALRAFLAKRLGIPRGSVRVVRGEKSRDKTVALTGVTPDRVRQALGAE